MQAPSVFFRLHPSLRQVLHRDLHWSELRTIQELAYDPIISGKDILITARTAGGKSEAAFIPVIDQILTGNPDLPLCLYISPLRALITDIADRLDHLLNPLHLYAVQVHGDAPKTVITDQDSPAMVLTTPESLTVLLHGGQASVLIGRVRICIIDEIHSLAASERGAQLITALSLMESRSGRHIQRVGLSATIGNPDLVLSWMSRKGRQAEVVRAEPDIIAREFIFLTNWDGTGKERLSSLIRRKRSLIFAQSRSEAENLAGILEGSDVFVTVHHSSLSPAVRKEAEELFLHSREGTIICTSTLELGIDIGDLDLVVQSGPVLSISSFLQRLGRVGRRADLPTMAFLLTDSWEMVLAAAAVSAAVLGEIEPVCPIRYPYRVLLQQIVLTLLSGKRTGFDELEGFLVQTISPPISGERIRFILFSMIQAGYLISDGGLLMAGQPLEKWAHDHRGAIYSVIGEGWTCAIQTVDGDQVGTLPHCSASRLFNQPFRLGGRTWISAVNHTGNNSVLVTKGSGLASPPSFGGSYQGMSPTLLRSVASIIQDGLPDLPFPVQVRYAVQEIARTMPIGAGPDTVVIREEEGLIRVYTFLGEDWNRVLGQYIRVKWGAENHQPPATGNDGVSFWIRGEDIDKGWVIQALTDFSDLDPDDSSLSWITGMRGESRDYDRFLPETFIQEMLIRDRFNIDTLIKNIRSRRFIIC